MKTTKAKPIVLDGRTGEGGGQLVRLAIGLAALVGQPIRITNIRGNRPKGGQPFTIDPVREGSLIANKHAHFRPESTTRRLAFMAC
jgi:RNA 3'-terminal phosphate cyclase